MKACIGTVRRLAWFAAFAGASSSSFVEGSSLRGLSAPAAAAPPTSPPRARLDLGFADFEKNLTAEVSLAIDKGLDSAAWKSPELRKRLTENVTLSLKKGLEAALKPLKLSIGKTWVALPADEQKAHYVSQLRDSFDSTLERAKGTVENHVRIGLRRANGFSMAAGRQSNSSGALAAEADGILAKAVKALTAGLLEEHCYGELKLSHNHTKKASAGKLVALELDDELALDEENATNSVNMSSVNMSKGFCIPSAIDSLARRLNDNAGLVGMTARFEANAMTLAQKSKVGSAQRQ